MAFLTSTVVSVRRGSLARQCIARSAGVRVAAAKPTRATGPRMETDWTGPAPSSDVLGIGKDTSSGTFITGSVAAFAVGVYCVYSSNIASPLSAESVNALYIIGSLGLPISWALYVFCMRFSCLVHTLVC